MKSAERKRIARALTVAGSGLQSIRERMVVATPIGSVLRGFCLEDSSDPHRVYVWAFVQPLFVPRTTVVLSLGERLGGGSHTWSVAEAEGAASALSEEGRQFFGPISSPAALARWNLMDGRTDEYSREAKAFALVASGQYSEGSRVLRAFAASLPAVGPAWMSEMRLRAEDLARRAETDGAAAKERLHQWESETRAAIRIGDVP